MGAEDTIGTGLYGLMALAVVFAGVSKGGFGSGAAFASASILALVMPPAQALALMLPLLMLIDLSTLRPYWRQWDWPAARALVLGALPGVALGAWLLHRTDADLLRLLIGGISVAFVGWQMALRAGWIIPGRRPLPRWGGALAGLVAGFTSHVSHAGGPAAAVYLLALGLGKTPYQATTVLVFGLINLAKILPYAATGMITAHTLLWGLALVPFALLGAWAGVRAHFWMPDRLFFALTYCLLTLTGVKLIWDGLT